MDKKTIYISIFDEDNQFDVEVYNWDEKRNTAGNKIKQLTKYALQTEQETHKYINKLEKQFNVLKVVNYKDEKQVFTLPTLKPNYLTYVLSVEEFEQYLSDWIFSTFGFKVDIEGDYDGEFVSFEINRETVEKETLEDILDEIGEEDFELNILEQIFTNYSSIDYCEYTGEIKIHEHII